MNSFEKKLADMIHDHPNLYDQSRRDYKDSLKAHVSWRQIADAMEKSEDEVKLKWKNLRDKFCKAKKRMVKRSGSGLTEETPAEKPVPVLFEQLAWLNTYVRPKVEPEANQVVGSGDDLLKERDKEEKELPGSLPVVSTSFSIMESYPVNHQELGVSLKRKRQTTTETEISSADALTNFRDEDELFLLSLLPSLKRLNIKKRMEVRMKFQQVLYAAEFDE
ncbi:uncharacterized protein LOC115437410 [Sphaeramia orbicularis]|uniref:uncharacterized protein LOC115437410 n=1 Tax=Sphaeramia orbicularis TaxID=375764 RepID=UPI00117F11BD|nr:uncharacterized protein LOC115437410 [Sphaeramia orbicularis]